MKLVSYKHKEQPSYDAVVTDGVIDLRTLLNSADADLKALLEADAVVQAHRAILGRQADRALSEIELLPVIPNPGKIWFAGLNYGEHIRETGREISEKPVYFLRFADSQVAHGQPISRPPESCAVASGRNTWTTITEEA